MFEPWEFQNAIYYLADLLCSHAPDIEFPEKPKFSKKTSRITLIASHTNIAATNNCAIRLVLDDKSCTILVSQSSRRGSLCYFIVDGKANIETLILWANQQAAHILNYKLQFISERGMGHWTVEQTRTSSTIPHLRNYQLPKPDGINKSAAAKKEYNENLQYSAHKIWFRFMGKQPGKKQKVAIDPRFDGTLECKGETRSQPGYLQYQGYSLDKLKNPPLILFYDESSRDLNDKPAEKRPLLEAPPAFWRSKRKHDVVWTGDVVSQYRFTQLTLSPSSRR